MQLLDEHRPDARRTARASGVRTDNGERLRIQIQAVKAFMPWPAQGEMIAQQWRKIGIWAEAKEMERNLAFTRTRNNEHHIQIWTNGGTEILYLFPRHAIPVDPTESFMGPEFAIWYASGGKQGRKPDDPNWLKIFELYASASKQAGGRTHQDRAGDLEDRGRPAVRHRHGRPVAGLMGVRIANNKLGNIPSRVCIAQHCRTPGGSHPETWFYKE